ncbi:protein PSK SIMULATOR 1 [Andrographis paniculata]|uniref:protein PSK SIMULATOR 1 n=1 Tax=Andrographis paniculata TaxID=175694 RepID=UPI0021E85F49|nr:protein PSK SIMULATOR 1 [Andrographis paniculata]
MAALETWLVKVRKTIAQGLDSVRAAPPATKKIAIRKSNVGVLAFEIAGMMSKLVHLWQSLSDASIARLRGEAICLEGVRKIVSNDDAFLLGLACAELAENLRLIAKSVARMSSRCEDPNLRRFDRLFDEFANSGRDPHTWLLNAKEMEIKMRKLDRLVGAAAALHREMDELVALENGLKKSAHSKENDASIKAKKITDLQQKIIWQRQQVKYSKEKCLWSRSFDTVISTLAKCVFTILARIKLVFGVNHGFPISLPRSLSASALVHPWETTTNTPGFVSGPLTKTSPNLQPREGFFDLNSKILKPPPTTLGAAALSLHYSNLIIVMEKMIRSPQLVGADARDDLYSMLPNSIRFALRRRLKGVGFSASDPFLAGEWRDALQKILGWLSPLAHNMIRWQSERSFEHQNLVPKTNVLLLQTLHFANQDKTEAAITELLVGLNYIWRFEREMNAKAILQYSNFNGSLCMMNSSPSPQGQS